MRRTRRGVLAALGGGLAGVGFVLDMDEGADAARAAGGAWPQPGADERNSGHVVEDGPREGMELWSRRVGSDAGAPLVAGGFVFPRSGGRQFDAATGEPGWRIGPTATGTDAPGGRSIRYSEVTAVADGIALVRGGATLYGLAIEDGSRQWAYALPGPHASVTVADGTAYVRSGANTQAVLIALRAADGEFRWRYRTATGGGIPAVVDGTLYLNLSGRLAALDAETGEELWSHAPPVADREPLTGTGDAAVAFGRSPVVSGDTVYGVDNVGRLHALDAADGGERWRFRPTEAPSVSRGEGRRGSRPVVADGVVYAGFTDGRVRAFDAATGEQRWSFRAWNAMTGAPAVTEGTVYVGGHDTMVYALGRASGERRWEFSTDGVVTGVSVSGVRAYAVTRHRLYALGSGGDA
jgi:outer membrane protein assembly factor BamB